MSGQLLIIWTAHDKVDCRFAMCLIFNRILTTGRKWWGVVDCEDAIYEDPLVLVAIAPENDVDGNMLHDGCEKHVGIVEHLDSILMCDLEEVGVSIPTD